jgi:hypothetical protein
MALGFIFIVVLWPIVIGISEILYRSRKRKGFFFELFVAAVICAFPMIFVAIENMNIVALTAITKSLVIPCLLLVGCTELIYRFTTAGSGKKHLAQLTVGLVVALVWPGLVVSEFY